jgi:protein-disulfide isomerase
VATKPPKKTPRYDLIAADRKRNLAIRIGLTAVVVIFAVALVSYILVNKVDKPGEDEAKSIRVSTSSVITKEGTSEPKAVLSLYEDFLCPACGNFEKQFGPTINKLIDSGAVAADYYMVSILDRQGDGYSTRSSNAAYCVADADKEAFRRFHAALYAQQPAEGVGPFPDNARLVEIARQAGVTGEVPDCINNGVYDDMAKGLAKATEVNSTPTIRINGQEWRPSTPDALIAEIEKVVGQVPALDAGAPAPNPDPTPPPAAPAP